MSNPLADMEKPAVIFCIGTNMTECHPVAATRLKRALARGAKMIVADPRRIALADVAEVYLPIRVGSDMALLLAMAHVIHRDGLIDEAFVAERTEDTAAFLEHIGEFTPEWASGICQVPAADIERAARLYGAGSPSAIYYTLGITEHICGVDNVRSLCNLALMTGNLGVEGGGINPMRGQNNIQGAGDCGAIPANFPGFQPADNPDNQAKFERLWGTKVDLDRSVTKVDALDRAAEGTLQAMLIAGENTAVSDANREHCEAALQKLDHLVVIDIFLTETAAMADVVLPATAFGETDGTATNTERRVQRLRRAVAPQGKAKPDWWIISQLAQRMGTPGFEFESAQQVFDELCSLSPIYAGLSWERVSCEALHWPVPDADHPGTPILHESEFKSGRGKFAVAAYRDPAETPSDEFPLWLTTGRRLQAYHTRTQTGRSAGVDYLLPEEYLEVHAEDMRRFGLKEGSFVTMRSPRGAVRVRARTVATAQPGTVFCSFSFNDVPVNFLTGAGMDPVTKTPELKVSVVRLEPVAAEDPAQPAPQRAAP